MKVIYVILAPLSFYYGKFLNIENFQKSEFKVEICDLSLMFYSKKDIKSYFDNTKNYNLKLKNKIVIKNFKSYEDYLNKQDPKKTIIYYTGRSFYKKYDDEIYFNYLFNKGFKIFLSEFSIEFFPTNIKEKLRLKYFIIKNNLKFRNYKNLNFIGCGENIMKISNKIYRNLNYFSFPHPNYYWKESKKNSKISYYIEESLDQSPDNRLSHKTNSVYKGFKLGSNSFINSDQKTIKKFYNKLNNFFSYIEKNYNTKIKILASGKFFYKKNPFNGREIIYNDTIKHISKSKFIIGHSSTALWQSFISKKKLIILADDLLSKAKLAEIKSFSLKTKTPILQMDEITKFKKYITSYSGSDNQNFIYYFLNNNNKKFNKSFKNLMLDCFIKVFKKG